MQFETPARIISFFYPDTIQDSRLMNPFPCHSQPLFRDWVDSWGQTYSICRVFAMDPVDSPWPTRRYWRNRPVATYFNYLRLTLWLKGWSIWKILLRARHRQPARRAGHTLGTPCSLVSCLWVRCTHQNHFFRPATAFTSFSALILLNHDK